MKSKCSFILKTSVALLLAILMVLGSVSTVIAAVVDVSTGDQSISTAAKKGLDIAGTAANADLSGTSATWSFSGGKIYFDNTRTKWTDSTIQLCIGKDSYTSTYTMTAVTNSNGDLYYADLPSSGWGDATYMAVIGNSGSWGSGNWGSSNLSNANHRTGTYTSGLSSSSGNRYYLIPSASTNGSSLTLSSTYQYNQKAYSYYSTNGTSYSSGATGGTTSIKAAYFGSDTSWTYTTDTTSPTAAWNNAVYSCTATFTATAKTGYEFVGWFSSTSATSATSTNATYTTVVRQANSLYARFKKSATNYTGITAVAKGTTDGTNYTVDLGSIQSSTTVSSATGLSVSAPTKDGYTFYKWVASGSGTFDSATSASTTFHPAANSEVATAQYKKNYTFSNDTTDTHGTVTVPSGTVLAGASYSGKVTPADGYKIKTLTVGGVAVSTAVGKTSAYTYSGTIGSSTTGTSTPISVVATFEANTAMNLYIAGRFHVKDSSGNWVNTFDSGDWKATSTKIPFTYLSGTTYKVDTNATLAELSGKISNYDPVFFVYDTTNSKNWYASSATTMSTSGTTLVSSGGADSNLKFNSTSTDGPVTIYYDSNTHKIWYSIPDLYNVTVGSVTGGSVTASPARCEAGTSVTLTITPSAGYTLQSITAKDSSNATVALSGSDNTRTFTMPAKDVTVTPVFQATNYTITYPSTTTGYTLGGSKPTQATVGTNVSFTVTPQTGYRIDEVKYNSTKITGSNNTYSFTMPAANVTIAVTASKVNTVKAVTNKSARGTVSVNKDTAAKNDSITITVSPKNGVLKSLTATYGNGAVYTCDLSTKAWTKTTNATTNANAAPASTGALETVFLNPLKSMFGDDSTDIAEDDVLINAKPEIASTGAVSDIAGVGVDTDYTMTLAEDSSVTINATFDNYSGESTWYYNGYDTSGNALSGYHGKQMTESMVSGEKFSYYHVEGRTGTDQLMTITDGSSPSYGKVYFTNNYNWNNLHVYFYGSSISWNWPGDGMTFEYNNGSGQAVYSYQIPSGATGVIFNNGQNGVQTQDVDLTSTNGAYYLTGDGASPYATQWDSAPSDAGIAKGVEYFYRNSDHNGDYTGDFNTKGFNNHYTANKEFAKPKDLGTNSGDYYINVLYPNTTYTINGVTKKTGTNPMIIWSAEPLAGDDENVTVYAKDGSIRSEAYGSTYANIADTKIYLNNETVGTKHSGNITNQTYETYKAAKGDTLVIKTQIGATDSSNLSNAADLKAKYYVRGFCVNGEVTELLDWNADGLYTLTYKVPEDDEDLKKIEITPIYYLKDTTANPIVTYRVTGFTDELKAVGAGKPNWGDTLYTYPFYGKLGSNNNALGAYPGQPMVYYKGQYQMQIPQKSTAWDIYYDDGALSGYSGNTAKANAVANTAVSGVTMSNGYYDIVHRTIMGYGSNGSSADHVQTYDYGDFYKIFNEKKPVDNIVFDFKYETKKHNFENQPAASITKSALDTNYGTNGNGFELLTNFHGRNVDLFGTPLSGDAADPSKTTPVYVVSIGGVNGSAGVENIAGYYATEWMVYGSSDGSSYSRISAGGKNSIPPEVLVLNDDDNTSFNTTTYPSADANHIITDWKALYTALEAYRGKPVMISYEAADAQIGAGNYATSGGGGATRNDGRWLYSKNGENITSNIRIDVSHDSGSTYTENPASGESDHVDGLSAYFTNADAYQKMTYVTTIDPDKTFDFEAKTTNASYKFVGWYMADGTKITSDNVSHTERSGSYTFVARFMEVSSGQLTLSHSVDTGAEVEVDGHYYTCDGSGTAKIGAVVTDAETNEVLRTFDLSSSDITIPEKYIGNDKNYNITVTLEATADTNTAYGTSKLANTDASSVTEDRFFNPKTPTTSGKTTTYTFTFNVKDDLYSGPNQRALALTYHSYFIQYKFNYQINYTFDDRSGKTKQYKRIGTLTPGEANTYVKKVDSNRYLDKSFIEKMAPYESNFGQDITWNFEDYLISNSGEDGSNYEYAIQAHYTATQSDLNKRNITFALPYQHNNGVAVMTADGVGTKASTTNLELIEVKDSEGTVTADNRVNFNTIPVLPNNGENGIFTEEGKKNWIAAPATITDGSATYNFQYWSVKPTDRAGENDPDVARCYFQGFNFVAYDNYIITPVYGATTVEPSDFGKNTNITYVETTRNQWNSNGTDYPKTQTSYASDLLYNDFIIAYNYDGKDIYNGEANGDIAELGVVVERIKKLEIKDDGSYDTTLSRYTDIAPNEEGVNAAIASATDINLSGKNSISKHAIDPTSLDNKNRIQFYNGIYNSAGWVKNSEGGQPEQNYAYKNYVYRAYSYMKLKNGDVIKSAVPAYFTMYDVATADLNNSN